MDCQDRDAFECAIVNMSSNSPWACVLITALIVGGIVAYCYLSNKGE